MLPKFEPDSLYDRYLPNTPDFEDKCYSAAVLKKTIHTYIYLNVCNLWFNMSFIPVESDDGLCYCAYSTEPAEVDDIDMACVQRPAIPRMSASRSDTVITAKVWTSAMR